VRATRVIYVENDPALRGILTSMLESSPEIEVILSTSSPTEALAYEDLSRPDVALLDLALGQGEMNGVDLGIALRQRNNDLGIVIHSQYPLDYATERVPAAELVGWSTLQKSGQLNLEELVKLLKTTAMGIAQRKLPDDRDTEIAALPRDSELNRLSTRQRAIMGLTASGFTPQQIAEQLSLSYDVVRQDLVRAYRILVPDEAQGDDRRTQAALAYVRLTRDEMWEAP
jgi:DNA-binding NarL/FixJ family response regulator